MYFYEIPVYFKVLDRICKIQCFQGLLRYGNPVKSPCELQAFSVGIIAEQSSPDQKCGQGFGRQGGDTVVGFGLHPTCAKPEVDSSDLQVGTFSRRRWRLKPSLYAAVLVVPVPLPFIPVREGAGTIPTFRRVVLF